MDGATQPGASAQGGFPQGGNFRPGGPQGLGRGAGMLPGGPVTSIVLIALFALTLIVLAVAFYKLFQKAGFSGVLGLLMLVPVVNLGVALYLAFAEWPVLTELARVKLVAASAALRAGTAPEAGAASADPTEPAIPLTA